MKILNYGKLIFLLVFFDQITKFFARKLSIANFNTGSAYGLFSNQTLFLTLINALVIFYLIYNYKKIDLPISIFLAGAIGNFIDRILFGKVTDFINIIVFPNFNFADFFLVLAVIMMIFKNHLQKLLNIHY